MGKGRTRSSADIAVLLLAVAIVVGAGVGAVGVVRSASAPARRMPALPRLGSITTVDQNDVGDPFILSIPAGVPPPTDVPYQSSGPDSYQSSPWSAAIAAAARAHGWYVLFGTNDWQANVPTAISPDLVHWTQAVEPFEAAAVREHLVGCPGCREEIAQHRQVLGMLASTGGAAPAGVWKAISART